jgi:outer membrane protein assembly factor BamD (BamD/ComL family)
VRKSETLADEVKLLGRVHAAIQSHDGVQALRLLQNYDQQFIRPQLREERAAAGVLALCAAGNVEAARRAAKRFQSNWPRSPLMGRVIDSCVASQ